MSNFKDFTEEHKEFLEKIDLSELEKHIGNLSGLDVHFKMSEVDLSRKIGMVEFEDPTNYSDKCGSMSFMYKKLTLFGYGSVYRNALGGHDFTCFVQFLFECKNGRKDALDVLSATCFDGLRWVFVD